MRSVLVSAVAALCAVVMFIDRDAAIAGEVLRIDDEIVKWQKAGDSLPTVVTYTILTSAYDLPTHKSTLSADNCGSMRPFSDIMSVSLGLSDAMARTELRSAFAAWERVADIRFVELKPPLRADIIIGAAQGTNGRAFANLSLTASSKRAPVTKALGFPTRTMTVDASTPRLDRPVAAIETAFICLNANSSWKIGFDGNLEVYDLRYTFMHEIGHAIGLDHPGSSGSVMAFRYDEYVSEPQPSDRVAARWLYGPPTDLPFQLAAKLHHPGDQRYSGFPAVSTAAVILPSADPSPAPLSHLE